MTQQAYRAAGEGYAERILTSPDEDIVEDRVVTAPGTYQATASLDGNWLLQLAVFRGVQSAPPLPTAPATATLAEAASPTARSAAATPAAGKTVALPTVPATTAILAAGRHDFTSASCGACHALSSVQGAVGTRGPGLNGIGKIRDAAWVLVQIEDPCAPGHAHAAPGYLCTDMPAGLAAGPSAQAIAAFLASQK
jgi:hypothetical protein